ncbi:hypothetical protein PFICI_02362 [Pestalotiopsis fici W106-1]|uniref:Uncharacterized protein n=1 Tax=Pestalotiopsis fici (strain W106-1 / CGMCC3.15140) TaxID=1229662 RepID=W3XFZ8_PESFW|nr:uncharacterized protein PFICI_02362 [Pestalotiopsis fici W106-1]ETS84337.1 hypothetical protein PFICI_02362 [Pestalotiopsis fici W106-1]
MPSLPPQQDKEIGAKVADTTFIEEGISDEKQAEQSNEAAQYLHDHASQYGSYSLDEAKKLVRKIDWRLMPLMWITTNLSAIDASQRSVT